MRTLLWVLLFIVCGIPARGCIWDSDTLADEKKKRPDIAQLVLGTPGPAVDAGPLRDRIKKLEAEPRKDDAAWWNDLAGSHLRLGESKEAAALLEPVLSKFPDDYGIHANLGTAYHLLGRYQDAEKEIARDLEINPGGHFGLEKYHLALLQYLVRDPDYQSRHVYVDELTLPFLQAEGPILFFNLSGFSDTNAPASTLAELQVEYHNVPTNSPNEQDQVLEQMIAWDKLPAYRAKWNLAVDTNFQSGVMYMASMNPKDPACLVMLGVVCWENRDLNLAATAFEKASALGSPQSEILTRKAMGIRSHIAKAQAEEVRHDRDFRRGELFGIAIMVVGLGFVSWVVLRLRARRR